MDKQRDWVIVDIDKFHEILPPLTDLKEKKENYRLRLLTPGEARINS